MQYRDLKFIIIDEISMCGLHTFWKVNDVLQEIFENQKPFGGISVLTVGDFNQLRPIKDSWVFEYANGFTESGRLLGPQLWYKFEIYELTEIMRQRNDIPFATALNNLAIGATTAEDDMLFRSRQMNTLGVEIQSLMDDIVALYYKNNDVDAYNSMYLVKQQNEIIISKAYDTYTGSGKKAQGISSLKTAETMHHKKPKFTK